MGLVLLSALFLAGISAIISGSLKRKKRFIEELSSSYGKVRENLPERIERLDKAAILFEHDRENIPDADIVDDITWNDLNMDDIFLNADHTDSFVGEQYLYRALRFINEPQNELEERDNITEFFDSNEDKRLETRKTLSKLGKSITGFNVPDKLNDIGSKKTSMHKLLPFLCTAPLIIAAAGAFLKSPVLILTAIVLYIINMIIHVLLKNSIELELLTVFEVLNVIGTIKSITKAVPEYSNEIEPDVKKFDSLMKKGQFLIQINSIETSNDIFLQLIYLFVSGFMTDLILFNNIIDDFEDKSDSFMNIYHFTGRIDYCISLGSFRRYYGNYCIPELTEKNQFVFGQLVHPLISSPVPNDVEYHKNMILTGSNASGKSTFIKSIAINIILGQTLHICFAECAIVPRCLVMSSMAVRDDILSGESYYIREIRYLKRMTELCKSGRLMLLAIDEILRGTNTKERIAASRAVLEYFETCRCMVITATHDRELAEYFNNTCENMHFCEEIKDGDIKFDYKLRKGISRTSNAIRLLGEIGFPTEIVSNAKEYVNNDN